MCGIAGFLGERGAWGADAQTVVRRMIDLLTHRGPDERGTWVGDGAAMACRRLAIVDIERGQQPIRDPESGTVVVFNGEIYEHDALRRELAASGFRFRTESDTEVLLAGYLTWGEEVFERVDGMLACAIFQPDKREMILARDRFGKKPLYYSVHNGAFHFASEMKSLLTLPGFERRLDDKASEHFLLFGHVFDPMTPFAGIHALPPAHLMRVRDDNVQAPRRYWAVPRGAKSGRSRSFADATDELSSLFADAVERRTSGDVAVGALLSGGIDSSLVCHALRTGDAPLDAFSITFSGDGLDESRHQDAVADHLGINLHRFDFEANAAAITQSYPEAQWFGEYADPSFEQDILFRHVTALAADKGYKVLLGGEGADELFRGYRYYQLYPHLLRYLETWDFEAVPTSLGFDDDDDFADLAEGERASLAAFGIPGALLDEEFPWSQLVEAAEFTTLANEVFARPPTQANAQPPPLPDGTGGPPSVELLQCLELHTRLPNYILRTLDRYSMASSVEVRCPFLDHRLFEWFMGLPAELRDRGPGDKPFLKELATPRLPASITARRKQGFRAPCLLTESLRSPDGRDTLRGLLSRDAVTALNVVRPELIEEHFHLFESAPLEEPRLRALEKILDRVLALRLLHSVFVEELETYEAAHLARHGVAPT